MKKFFPYISFGLVGLIFLSSVTLVSADLCPVGQFKPLCNLKLEKASDITGNIVTVLLVTVVIIALIFLIYGGVRWAMSAGDKQKLETAQITIRSAIVGLIISLSAYFILNIITYLFTGSTILTFTIPRIVP